MPLLDSPTVLCRANCTPDCHHNRPNTVDEPMEEDGTFDGSTIVCDSCYTAILPFTLSGQALHHEIDDGIAAYKSNLEFVQKHDDPAVLLMDAENQLAGARPHSAWARSTRACRDMAKAELQRRASLN